MVRAYKRKSTRNNWTEDGMAGAIQQVLEGKMGYTAASKVFEVPRTTLRKRISVIRTNKLSFELASSRRLGRSTIFSEHQENELVDHIIHMEESLFRLSMVDVRRMAFDLAEKNGLSHTFNQHEKMAGKDWLYSFLARHPEVSLITEKTSLARAKKFSRVAVANFYDLLESIYTEYKISPSDIYNVEEADILTVPNTQSKVLTRQGKKEVGCLSSEREVLVTVETCMSASGNFMPLMFVIPSKEENALLLDGAPPGSFACFSESGEINKDSFLVWFKRFIEFSNPSPDKPVLLLLDGQESYTKSLGVIELARENNIFLLCFPPHTMHCLQPLDVVFMGPLGRYYEQEVQQWLIAHPVQGITIRQIGKLLGRAFSKAAVMETAVEGFQKTGIYPFNRCLFPDYMFALSETISAAQDEQMESWTSEGASDGEEALPSTSGGSINETASPQFRERSAPIVQCLIVQPPIPTEESREEKPLPQTSEATLDLEPQTQDSAWFLDSEVSQTSYTCGEANVVPQPSTSVTLTYEEELLTSSSASISTLIENTKKKRFWGKKMTKSIIIIGNDCKTYQSIND